jgi:hypothetical protein
MRWQPVSRSALCTSQQTPNQAEQLDRLLLPIQVVADAAAVTNAAYATLGLAGASFVGTFFVAPRFKDSFKEDIDWRDMYKELVQGGGVPSITPREAFNKRKRQAGQLEVNRAVSRNRLSGEHLQQVEAAATVETTAAAGAEAAAAGV